MEDLKVLAGEQFDSDVEEGGKKPLKQRESKAQSKSKPKQDFSTKLILTSKIGRLVSILDLNIKIDVDKRECCHVCSK